MLFERQRRLRRCEMAEKWASICVAGTILLWHGRSLSIVKTLSRKHLKLIFMPEQTNVNKKINDVLKSSKKKLNLFYLRQSCTIELFDILPPLTAKEFGTLWSALFLMSRGWFKMSYAIFLRVFCVNLYTHTRTSDAARRYTIMVLSTHFLAANNKSEFFWNKKSKQSHYYSNMVFIFIFIF